MHRADDAVMHIALGRAFGRLAATSDAGDAARILHRVTIYDS